MLIVVLDICCTLAHKHMEKVRNVKKKLNKTYIYEVSI